MKRVLALALVGAALLLGGCDRQPASAPPAGRDRPATTPAGRDRPAATESPTTTGTGKTAATTGTSDVGSLLDDVDKQLGSDDQPPADQD